MFGQNLKVMISSVCLILFRMVLLFYTLLLVKDIRTGEIFCLEKEFFVNIQDEVG